MGTRHFGARESEVGCMFSACAFEPHASSKPNASSKSESSSAPSSRSKTISGSSETPGDVRLEVQLGASFTPWA